MLFRSSSMKVQKFLSPWNSMGDDHQHKCALTLKGWLKLKKKCLFFCVKFVVGGVAFGRDQFRVLKAIDTCL